ncbi:MAG TPA: HEAT repeat domain-containing protein [Candidatus Brocadiia bacterium]|nr:HEAT repeat domain-containing protein [Candidatus Brocadiia bacterium]
MRTTIRLLAGLIVAALCMAAELAAAEPDIQTATQDGQRYSNAFLGMTFDIPEGWAIADEKTRAKLLEQAFGQVAATDPFGKMNASASKARTKSLLLVSEKPIGTYMRGFNPSLILIAEDVGAFPGVASGKTYLEHTRKGMTKTNMPFKFSETFGEFAIGGEIFATMDGSAEVPFMGRKLVVRQKYLSTVRNDYALGFIMSYTDESHFKMLIEALRSLEFKPPAKGKSEQTLDDMAKDEAPFPEPEKPEPSVEPDKTASQEVRQEPEQPATEPQPASLDDLLALLKSDQTAQRQRALRLLTENPPDGKRASEATLAVLPCIERREEREDALRALAAWGTADCVPALAEYLAGRPNDGTAKLALEALERLKDPRSAQALAALLEEFFQREKAEKALAALGKSAQPAVLPYVNHQDGGVRESARKLLKAYKTPPDEIAAQCLLDLQDDKKAETAIRFLSESEPSAAKRADVIKALAPLILDAPHPNQEVRKAMAKWATRKESPVILKCAVHANPGVRDWAINLLIDLDEPKVIPIVAEGIKDFSGETRHYLNRLGTKAEKAVCEQMNSPEWNVRKSVCEALGEIGTRRSLPLLKRATQDESMHVRKAAEAAIEKIMKK